MALLDALGIACLMDADLMAPGGIKRVVDCAQRLVASGPSFDAERGPAALQEAVARWNAGSKGQKSLAKA